LGRSVSGTAPVAMGKSPMKIMKNGDLWFFEWENPSLLNTFDRYNQL
jgi:hypothetical protein